jgi:hypothetical protein
MLFYTGANKSGAIQGNPSLSLGGWVSSSQVPNDFMNNLFSDIDYTTVKTDSKPIRVLAFKNLSGAIIPSFQVYTVTPPTSYAKLKIGIILNAIDESCSCPYFEQIPSEFASPSYVTLLDCEGVDNALTLLNIPIGQYVGIFVQRVLIPENNSDYKGKAETCADFNNDFLVKQAQLVNPEIPDPEPDNTKEDEIEIVFTF